MKFSREEWWKEAREEKLGEKKSEPEKSKENEKDTTRLIAAAFRTSETGS